MQVTHGCWFGGHTTKPAGRRVCEDESHILVYDSLRLQAYSATASVRDDTLDPCFRRDDTNIVAALLILRHLTASLRPLAARNSGRFIAATCTHLAGAGIACLTGGALFDRENAESGDDFLSVFSVLTIDSSTLSTA